MENITHEGQLLAVVLPGSFNEPGIHFCTPSELSQQLAYMRHDAGKTIEPHIHQHVQREVRVTQEVLVIRRGRLRVDFYDDGQRYIASRELTAGDVILLVSGGHGFEVIEDLEMIEVKQGPYIGEADKVRFRAVSSSDIQIRTGGDLTLD